MFDKDDLTLSYNQEAKCPYCGFDDYDSWELNIDEGCEETTYCPSCGKEYGVMRHIEITYSTWALDECDDSSSLDEKEDGDSNET